MSRNNCRAKRAKSKPWFQRPIFLPIGLRRSAGDSVVESVGIAWYVVDIVLLHSNIHCTARGPCAVELRRKRASTPAGSLLFSHVLICRFRLCVARYVRPIREGPAKVRLR